MFRKFAAIIFAFAFAFSLAAAEATAQQNAAAKNPRKHTDAEYAVAFAFCDAAGIAESQRNVLRMTLDSLTRNNPTLRELRPTLERIIARSLGYEAVKYDYADLFLDEFTLDELRELTRLSKLPVMRKYLSKQQTMMQAGSMIAKKHLAPHQQEIRAEIRALLLKKAAAKAAAKAAEAEQIRQRTAAQPAAEGKK